MHIPPVSCTPGPRRAAQQLLARAALAVLLAGLGFWTHPSAASAAPDVPLTLDVDRPDDAFAANACTTGAADDCSLRGAIYRANLNPGSTIRLMLSNTYVVSDATRGRLVITSPMTIMGVANPQVLCLASPCYAHIRAAAGWTTRLMDNHADLTLRSVSLRGGNEVMASGGGLFNAGSARIESSLVMSNSALFDGAGVYNIGTLTVVSSTFRGNVSTSPAVGDGGALFNRFDGSARLTGAVVQFNQATRGGGVFSEGPLTLVGTTVADNAARVAGGGVYVLSTTLAVTSSAVTSNTADVSGGGLHGLTATVAISDSVLRANVTISPAGRGGGAFIADGRLHLHAARVTANASMYGGGLDASGSDVTVMLSEFSRNVAEGLLPAFAITTGAGGAIRVAGPGSVQLAGLRVERSRFEGNRSAGGGGALSVLMAAGVLTDTLFIANLAPGGGAAGVGLGSLALVRSAVVSNTATDEDGGGLTGSFSSLRLDNATVSGNRAAGSGGGVLWDNGSLRSLNATIAYNTADADGDGDGGGGGLLIARGTATLSNTIVADNADLSPITKTVDCGGVIESLGYNLFGTTAGCAITGTLAGNITASASLAPLAPNGSPFTLSHLPSPGSPARDAGDPAGCKDVTGQPFAIDQRGWPRPRDGDGDGLSVCDIGAVEAGGSTLYLPITQRNGAAQW